MFQFLESICFEREGYPLLGYHQQRVDRAFQYAYPGRKAPLLQDIVPKAFPDKRKYKIRVLYNETEQQVEVIPYKKRPITSVKLVSSNIEYAHKYADRSELASLFNQRGSADEVLIVKKGFLTDSSYTNIALLKDRIWHTPSTPILVGVRRTALIDSGKLEPNLIRPEDLQQFEQLSLFNAMIDLGELVLPMDRIQTGLK